MTTSYFKSDQKIDYLLRKFRSHEFDDYTQSHIANYACVLLSGLLEASVREIISSYCESRASPPIANFVKDRLERFQNPDPESVSKLLTSFDQKFADDLEAFWIGEIKDAIGSIVGNRHLIAHGRDTSLTLVRVADWFRGARRFIEFLEHKFK